MVFENFPAKLTIAMTPSRSARARVAQRVANPWLFYLDSGAMYRAFALKALQETGPALVRKTTRRTRYLHARSN